MFVKKKWPIETIVTPPTHTGLTYNINHSLRLGVPVSQHAQYPGAGTDAPEWIAAVIYVIGYTSGFTLWKTTGVIMSKKYQAVNKVYLSPNGSNNAQFQCLPTIIKLKGRFFVLLWQFSDFQ